MKKKQILKNISLGFLACGAFSFIVIGNTLNFLLIGLLPKKNIDYFLETNLIIKLFVVYGQILGFLLFICFAITLVIFFRKKPEQISNETKTGVQENKLDLIILEKKKLKFIKKDF